MNLFRLYLVATLVVLVVYTLVVGSEHGWNLLPIFFSDIAEMTWRGQFNVDFMTFLGLSGGWVAWRQRFSPLGLCLGLVAFFGGMMFLAGYLLVLSFRCNGDVTIIMFGRERPGR
jgi:hypothetical protein